MPVVQVLLSFVLLLTFGAIAAAEPSRSQVENVVSRALPAHLQIERLAFRNFPGAAGTGRVSIEGTARLTQDTFVADEDAWLQALIAQGADRWQVDGPDGAARVQQRHIEEAFREVVGRSSGQLLVRAQRAGAVTVPFRYEYHYRETVRGIDFSRTDGWIARATIRGTPRNAIDWQRFTALNTDQAERLFGNIQRAAERALGDELRAAARFSQSKADFERMIADDLIWIFSSQRLANAPFQHRARMRISDCAIGFEKDDSTMNIGGGRTLAAISFVPIAWVMPTAIAIRAGSALPMGWRSILTSGGR